MQFDLIGAAILDFEIRVGEVRLTVNLRVENLTLEIAEWELVNSDFAVQMERTIEIITFQKIQNRFDDFFFILWRFLHWCLGTLLCMDFNVQTTDRH